MIDLDDIRQDIFDIKTVPKVLYVYRGDTDEVCAEENTNTAEIKDGLKGDEINELSI